MPDRSRIDNHSGVPDAAFERAAAILEAHGNLHDVLTWCHEQASSRDLADVVVQDEFTHDIVLQLEDELFAVYDAT